MNAKTLSRIDGILSQIKRLRKIISNVSFEDFIKSETIIAATSFSLLQIGERMVKLEQLLSDKYPSLPWQSAIKMRNLLVHDYDIVDYKTVYETATEDIDDLEWWFLKIKDDIKHISDNSIYTYRLTLRPWDDLDSDELFELAKEPEIGYWCGWAPHKHIRDTVFALHNFLEIKNTFAICLKETGEIIGSIGLHFGRHTDLTNKDDECELGYWIGKPFWGKGYASEASEEMIRYAFEELGVSTIWCGYFEGNEKSKRIQEKHGFIFRYSQNEKNDSKLNELRTVYVSCLTRDEWLSRR